MNKRLVLIIGIVILAIGAVVYFKFYKSGKINLESSIDSDESSPPPAAVNVTKQDLDQQPKDNSALGGYNVLIADRGNNRLIEVTPDKQIVWEYDFHLPKPGLGADDAFFADGGKTIIVNLEEYHIIELIDYQTKSVIWEYGQPGVAGHLPGFLNTPDDAYKLPNGNITVADIKNCRVIEITPDKQLVRQYGMTRICDNKSGDLDSPNGDTPIANGHTYISTIRDHKLTELDEQWQPVFQMNLPAVYPSDPQPTQAGNILVSDYTDPGKIVEVTKQGQIVWEFAGDATAKLNRPSLAIELPNGNILANDDFNHRIIVIDKQTKQIIWQYGVTGKPGNASGQLNIPDGMDIIKRPGIAPVSIGSVTRHASDFSNQTITVLGYLLKKENGYDIFSDEPTGALGNFDLPVTGNGLDKIVFNQKYTLQGVFTSGGLTSINGNPNHLELSGAPQPAQ